MPSYEYRCTVCKKKFTVTMNIAQHDRRRPACPKCKSTRVQQQFAPFFSKTSRKS